MTVHYVPLFIMIIHVTPRPPGHEYIFANLWCFDKKGTRLISFRFLGYTYINSAKGNTKVKRRVGSEGRKETLRYDRNDVEKECISGCQHQRLKRQKEVNLPHQLVSYHSHSRNGRWVMVCTTSTQIHDSPSSRDPSRPSFANMLAALDARRCGEPVIVA